MRCLVLFIAKLVIWPLLMLGPSGAVRAQDFLEPEKAFKVSAVALDDRSVEVRILTAPGYYLYRESLKFAAEGASLGDVRLPAGKVKYDETFAKDVETYRDLLRVAVPVENAATDFRLVVTSQGCADAGLCYPPMLSGFKVRLAASGGAGTVEGFAVTDPGSLGTSTSPVAGSEPVTGAGSPLGAVLRGGRLWAIVGAFFLAGVLLSLTPCVLPMLPIVSAIIAGHGVTVSRRRGLSLAAAYSLGMAIVYTAFGVAAGLAGEGLAAALQTPAVLGVFAAGLVVLSMSMFGFYELRLPSVVSSRVMQVSNRLPTGRLAGVCAMGGASALLVSPCVAAPLAGALVYLSQTRDVVIGGTALFALAAGMSLPLLLLGASAGAVLPKAGPWMDEIKGFFGFLLLGVALWTVQPLLLPTVVLALWGLLLLVAMLLVVLKARRTPGQSRFGWRHALASILGLVGGLQLVGAAAGSSDPLEPLAALSDRVGAGREYKVQAPTFIKVRSNAELDAVLRSATRPVLLDFYADWCVSCKEMERYTYRDSEVRAKLDRAILLKADVTANSADDRALLKRFGLYGPPGTLFFAPGGQEVDAARVIGYQNSASFLQTLQLVGL